jgi:orotate phosphoribosyltransferase
MYNLYSGGYCSSAQNPAAHIRALRRLNSILPGLLDSYKADGIAVRGHSGVSMAYGLRALALHHGLVPLPFFLVRKESQHHGAELESLSFGMLEVKRYLILDDFISSGKTVETIIDRLDLAECAGIVCYENMGNEEWSPVVKERYFFENQPDGLLLEVHR